MTIYIYTPILIFYQQKISAGFTNISDAYFTETVYRHHLIQSDDHYCGVQHEIELIAVIINDSRRQFSAMTDSRIKIFNMLGP